MAKERFLTVMVPIKDSDCESGTYTVGTLPAVNPENINKIYKMSDGTYRRLWYNPSSEKYEYHAVVDREFPHIGQPLEIFDFTYDATRMGSAPTITAQNVMWFADKDANGNSVTLEDLWTQECHVTFNGDNLYLKQIPTSSKSNEDARYKYDLDFVSERVVLETVYLYDVVQPFITDKPISESATFSFYGDVYELAKRINASLLKSGLAALNRKHVDYDNHAGIEVPYLSYTQWCDIESNPSLLVGEGKVFPTSWYYHLFRTEIFLVLKGDYNRYLMQYIYENVDGVYVVNGYQVKIGKDNKGEDISTDEKLIQFDKNTIHDALQRVFDDFELQYYVEKERDSQGSFTGNTVIWIADCQHDFADWDSDNDDYVRDEEGIPTTEHPFDYGLDFDNNGNDSSLLSKEKANSTDKIITRITGVGSSENIPWYYPNPTADGWLKPVFKTKGVIQTDVDIDYPTSEGTTVADAMLYEKFLKNRIGNIIERGIQVGLYTESDVYFFGSNNGNGLSGYGGGGWVPPLIETDNGIFTDGNGVKYINVNYHFSTKGLENRDPCLTLKMSCADLNCTKIKSILDRETMPVAMYDSSHTYTNPNAFQTMFKNADGYDRFPLLAGHDYFLNIQFYVSSLPYSQEYEFEGYRYLAATINYTGPNSQYADPSGYNGTITPYTDSQGVQHSFTVVPAKLGEDFYDLSGLIPYVVWGCVSTYVNQNTACYHEVRPFIGGYSVDGTRGKAVSPIPRVEGKRYLNLSSSHIHVCKTSLPANIYTGVDQYGFLINPGMDWLEWIRTFVKMLLRMFVNDGWYIGNKKIELSDYGLGAPTRSGTTIATYIFDTIEFQRVKYITPQSNLMPEVYIKTDGERRFYEAHNYWDKENSTLYVGTADTAIGEVQSGTKVKNPIFKEKESDADSKHYEFENEFLQNVPKEHIEDFDDVKPTIKEQKNYIPLSVTQTQFEANKTFFYTYNSSTGVYTQCTSSSTYSSSTQYYALLRIDVVEEFAYDLTDNDEIWETSDGGNISGEYKHPYFFARLRPMGFNLFDMALQDDMVLSMTTGHCGACNFKIAVDENTKKNTVQVWEHDVYEGTTLTSQHKVYNQGDLRRYTDDRNLYYNVNGEAVQVNTNSFIEEGGLMSNCPSTQPMFNQYTYSADAVADGLVGTMKGESSVHFEGDVVTSGRFIDSQQDTSESFVWIALMKDTETYGTIMPSARQNYNDPNLNQYIRPKSIADVRGSSTTFEQDDENADKFVLTNIRLPQVYLRRAERDLARKLVAYMYDNNYQKFNFSIKFSRIFLAQNISVDEDLNENSVLYVSFNNKTYRQYVKHYSYKMSSNAVLPEITIDMNENLPLSRTSVEQQAAMQYKANKWTIKKITASTAQAVKKVTARTIGKNDTTIISGSIVNRSNKTSFSEVCVQSKTNKTDIVTLNESMESKYFKIDDFVVENGTDINIANRVFLSTPYNTDGVLRRRKFDVDSMSFKEDESQRFAPMFLDSVGKTLKDFHETYVLLSAEPIDFSDNFDRYYKLVSGEYVALSEAETFAANTYYRREEGSVNEELTPARVSGKQITYGANGVLKPLVMDSNVISERNYTLLTSQPSDWGTHRLKYYTKDANGDFVPITGTPKFEANKFYEETPTNYDFTQTTEYYEIVQSFDQLEIALHCATVTITPDGQGGYIATFNYSLPPARQNPEEPLPDRCSSETGNYWFRTTT